QITVVEFETMAMALVNDGLAIHLAHATAFPEMAHLRAKSHGPPQVAGRITMLGRAGTVLPFLDQRDHGMRRAGLEFGRMRAGKPGHVAREFDHRDLHAETNAEIGYAPRAGKSRGENLAFDPAP